MANMAKKIRIWDIDGTTVDSSHRVKFDNNGKFDLAHWVANSVPEQVFKDKLLPLAKFARQSILDEKNGQNVENVILTARHMGKEDYEFLYDKGLAIKGKTCIMSRDRAKGNAWQHASDVEYKAGWLDIFMFVRWEITASMIQAWDDNPGILGLFKSFGIVAHDAARLNREMGHNYIQQWVTE